MSESDQATTTRPTDSAKSVLLTVLGEFVLPAGGEVWTRTLIDGLALLDYNDRNTRQAMARLRDDGVIEPVRHGRRTRWHLTGEGRRLLEAGAERIYRFGAARPAWDRRWLAVVCPVPETQRDKRRRLHTRLSFAGFGFLTSTMAVSPHMAAEPVVNEILADLDLEDVAVVLRAGTGDLTDDADLVARAWDLDDLRAAYRDFVVEFDPLSGRDEPTSFAQTVRLVHAWRQFPFADPDLPAELLPADWIGVTARRLFDDARTAWASDAIAFFKALEGSHDG